MSSATGPTGQSLEFVVEQIAGDLIKKAAPAVPAEARPEMQAALRQGVQDLRQRGLSDQEIHDHLVRIFYTVRERLFSSKETRPSLLWTIFEYIGGLPVLVVVLVWLIPMVVGFGTPDPDSEAFRRMVGFLLQIGITALLALHVFLSKLDVSGGRLHRRRLLFLQQAWRLSEIDSLEFEKTHLFGPRRIKLQTPHQGVKIQSKTRGFHSAAFLLSFLPEGIMPPAVRKHLREAWLKIPLETARFKSVAACVLLLANFAWYWKWEDVWAGNGITWYSLGSLILGYLTVGLMGGRVTGSARLGVLRFLLSYYLSSVLLVHGLLIGPVHTSRMALYPLSLCVSLPLLVLFCRERVSLVMAFIVLSILAGYQMMAVYRTIDDGLLFSTEAAFALEFKQKSDGYAWMSVAYRGGVHSLGQTSNGDVIDTPLGADPWLLLPSKPDEVYVGLARGVAALTSAPLARIRDDGELELLEHAPARWSPLKWNSELIWSPDSSHLLLPVPDTGEGSALKVVSIDLRNGEQNDFGGMGSSNIVQWLDAHRFEAVWFDLAKLGDLSSAHELKLLRYDVRTSESVVINTVTLKPGESVSAEHLPRSPLVLIQGPAGPKTQHVSIVNVADGTRHDLGIARSDSVHSWNGDKRLFACAAEGDGETRLKVLDTETSRTTEKACPPRTRIRQLSLSPDGKKLFFLSYRRGFPYIFGRMIKGDVWDQASGKVQGVYCPGAIQGILMVIATHRLHDHTVIQWASDSGAIIGPELDLTLGDMRSGQKFYRRPVAGNSKQ